MIIQDKFTRSFRCKSHVEKDQPSVLPLTEARNLWRCSVRFAALLAVALPFVATLLAVPAAYGQTTGVTISDSPTATPDASAILDVSVTGSLKKGVLIPRMTEAERTSITLPAIGLLVYQTDGSAGFYYYTGSGWTRLTAGSAVLPTGSSGQTLRNDGTNWVANSLLFNNGTNVGVGTTIPGAPLAVHANTDEILTLSRTTNNASDLVFLGFSNGNNSSPSNTRARIGLDVKQGGAGRLVFYTNNFTNFNERMRIDEVGRVGIGTTTPNYFLSVVDRQWPNGGLSIANSDVQGNPQISFDNPLGTQKAAITFVKGTSSLRLNVGGTDMLEIQNGKLGIGMTSPTEQLEISGNLRLPPSTASVGVIKSGANRLIHNFGNKNFFAGVDAGNFTMLFAAEQNTAIGYEAFPSNTEGIFNTAIGTSALYSNTTGSFNTACGQKALYGNTTGTENTAVGRSAGQAVTGDNNTALGSRAGVTILSGSNNTVIGYNAQVPTGNGSNQIRIGDANITYAGVQVGWTVTSDRRYKENILPSNLGLSFISKLSPVSYTRKNDEKHRTEYGLIAQEVEQVLKECGVDHSSMLTITDQGMYELRYNDLFAPMIKAIQELSAMNKELKSRLSELEEQVKVLVEYQRSGRATSLVEAK